VLTLDRAVASNVDTLLKKQLASAGKKNVGAVFTLRGAERADRSTEETTKLVNDLVRRTEQTSKTKPAQVSLFANVQSFAVEAPAPFIRALVASDKIASAMANVQEEDLLIRPVSPKRARKKPQRKR
jgi:hypothetical protein